MKTNEVTAKLEETLSDVFYVKLFLLLLSSISTTTSSTAAFF